MKKTLTLLVMALALAPGASYARMGYMKKFVAAYPNAKKVAAMGCAVCHENQDDFARNLYGAEFEKAGMNFKAIEGLDTDGDSFTNLEELTADTNPSDKNDHPTRD